MLQVDDVFRLLMRPVEVGNAGRGCSVDVDVASES